MSLICRSPVDRNDNSGSRTNLGFVLTWKPLLMHIPDGFLSTPVWAGSAAVAAPVVGYCLRRTQSCFETSRTPLLGVMGAFVFAAQMIHFPLGAGTSGHLTGAALLAATLGPSAATVVMTAILVVQALVFQDGGVLALGANVLNLAVVGVWIAYLPLRWSSTSSGRARRAGAFLGAWMSLVAVALLASAELSFSRVAPPASVFTSMLAIHALLGIAEGLITTASLAAMERLNPAFVYADELPGR